MFTKLPKPNPTLEILLKLLASLHRKDEVEQVQLCTQIQDWDYFLFLLNRHQIGNLLATTLFTAAKETFPENVSNALKKTQVDQFVTTGNILRTLTVIDQKFREEELSFWVIKGPVLSQILYGSAFARATSDLDIVVRLNDFDKADQLLIKMGYQRKNPKINLAPRAKAFYLSRNHHYQYVSSNKHTIELHWAVVDTYFIDTEITSQMLDRGQSISIGNMKINTLSLDDTFLLHATHSSIHSWLRAKYLIDALQIFLAGNPLNWESIITSAKEANLERVVALNFLLLNHFFSAEIPVSIQEIIKKNPKLGKTSAHIIKNLIKDDAYLDHKGRFANITLVMYLMQLKPDIASKIKIFMHPFYYWEAWNDYQAPDNALFIYILVAPYFWFLKNYTKGKRPN